MEKSKWEQLTDWSNETMDTSIVKVVEITALNHRPHPYMIGPGHMPEHSIYLDERAIQEAESRGITCYWKGKNGDRGERCTLPYRQHTSDRVAILELQRNVVRDEIIPELQKLQDEYKAKGVDGYMFLETEEEYRVTDAVNETAN